MSIVQCKVKQMSVEIQVMSDNASSIPTSYHVSCIIRYVQSQLLSLREILFRAEQS